jgi:hypothetical protein
MNDTTHDTGRKRTRRGRRKPTGSEATAPADANKRCIREGCGRYVPRRKQHHDACSFICHAVAQEMVQAQRVCAVTRDTELWVAVLV